MKPDDDPEKWEMKGQTEMKHEILANYLQPWLFKISEKSSEVRYVDGFAGRGKYESGEDGSPVIALNTIDENIDSVEHKLSDVQCSFIEANKSNYDDLNEVVGNLRPQLSDIIDIDSYHGEFDTIAHSFILTEDDVPPSFIFIDPFGFSGVPFDTVSDLVNLRSEGVEVFITFMSGKMAQYMENDQHKVAISGILGTSDWEENIDSGLEKDERAEQLVGFYEKQLREVAEVEYVWPFEVMEESKRQNCYYLIHATNHFDGLQTMKDVMYNAGADGQFAYLGPDHYPYIDEQQSLGTFGAEDADEQEDIEDLAEHLHGRFKGMSLTFRDVMKQTYEQTTLIEKHYRRACYHLEDQRRISIDNAGRDNGGTDNGLKGQDVVNFKKGGLSKFLNQSS